MSLTFIGSQLLGTVVLGAGIWLAVDKSSLIALLKMVESEHLEVSTLIYSHLSYIHIHSFLKTGNNVHLLYRLEQAQILHVRVLLTVKLHLCIKV